MKYHVLLVGAICSIGLLETCVGQEREKCDINKWVQFKLKYNKSYENLVEHDKRRSLFCKSLNFIDEHNAKVGRQEVAVNYMADWSDDERRTLQMSEQESRKLTSSMANMRTVMPNEVNLLFNFSDSQPLPDYMDYRFDERVITPVKNQGQCGSCWAFGTTALVEAMEHKWDPTIEKAESLSEQQLVDCLYPDGCSGGRSTDSFEYIMRVGGMMKERDYPYKERKMFCKYKPEMAYPTTKNLTGFLFLAGENEELMKKVLALYGPITVSIQATKVLHYIAPKEIYKDPNCNGTTNHVVLIVGYGTNEAGEDYWIFKNSWGIGQWGDKGYGYLARNMNNTCSVATRPFILI